MKTNNSPLSINPIAYSNAKQFNVIDLPYVISEYYNGKYHEVVKYHGTMEQRRLKRQIEKTLL